MQIHVVLGLLVAIAFCVFFAAPFSYELVWYGVAGALIPDMEHFVYYYSYGKRSAYSKRVRLLLRRGNVIGFAHYCAKNHKHLHGLYGHSLYTVILLAVLFSFTHPLSSQLAVFVLAAISHYLFDITEDIILLGKINPNWMGKFS